MTKLYRTDNTILGVAAVAALLAGLGSSVVPGHQTVLSVDDSYLPYKLERSYVVIPSGKALMGATAITADPTTGKPILSDHGLDVFCTAFFKILLKAPHLTNVNLTETRVTMDAITAFEKQRPEVFCPPQYLMGPDGRTILRKEVS